jgi:hypothetical protein
MYFVRGITQIIQSLGRVQNKKLIATSIMEAELGGHDMRPLHMWFG